MAALIVIGVFYLLIVVVGVLAARKFKVAHGEDTAELAMVAGRRLGIAVGIITTAGMYIIVFTLYSRVGR